MARKVEKTTYIQENEVTTYEIPVFTTGAYFMYRIL
jgi:hypothetical protein